MLIAVLISLVVVLALLQYYIFFLAPRINPYNRAEKFIDQGLIDEAILEYNKILEHKPEDVFVHNQLADLYRQQEQHDLAVQHLEEILSLDRYTPVVEKKQVLNRLGKIYLLWEETEKAFQAYLDVLKINPLDLEALYQVAFIALAHGYYELAYRHFERLASQSRKSFEIQFGAGVAAFQNQKTVEALAYFKDALANDPHSDIGNLAMAFALFRRRDYKTAANYARMVAQSSEDDNARFVGKRLMGILLVQAKKADEGVKAFQELLEYSRKQGLNDEEAMVLYDLGFACLNSEKTDMAYEYWNQLYKIDRAYRDVQRLVMMLRKEMDEESKKAGGSAADLIFELTEKWAQESFPENYIYSICGLKSDRVIDLSAVMVTARIPATKTATAAGEKKKAVSGSIEDKLDAFISLDPENFRILSNRVASKLGFSVDEILPSYRENDGVDFMARSNKDKSKTLIWVRRWKGTSVGEIPLRNFAQAVNDAKARQGLFITVSDLTETGEDALKRLEKISVVYPEQLAVLLGDLL
jgi:tetratricopeptide (TPR) repeat protein